MRVWGIDPGPAVSSAVLFDGTRVLDVRLSVINSALLQYLHDLVASGPPVSTTLAIEKIAAMGQVVGGETLETVFWSGRFVEAWDPHPWARVTRGEVKMHLCESMRAKDKNVRQALIDKFGGDSVAIGKKKSPGPLYGISSHCWAALAVAVTWLETKRGRV
jgi:hypothetical protein